MFYNAEITAKNFGIDNELILDYLPESFRPGTEAQAAPDPNSEASSTS